MIEVQIWLAFRDWDWFPVVRRHNRSVTFIWLFLLVHAMWPAEYWPRATPPQTTVNSAP